MGSRLPTEAKLKALIKKSLYLYFTLRHLPRVSF